MNAIRAISTAAALALLAGFPALAEDWTTIDGKVYQDVRVVKVEDDAVTILDRDGGALVPLKVLPPALQVKFHYDMYKASAAADARLKGDLDNLAAISAERVQAQELQAARDAKFKADKKAVEGAKAAAEAAEPPDDPLHVADFDVGKSDDSRTHYKEHQALSTNDPDMPVRPAP